MLCNKHLVSKHRFMNVLTISSHSFPKSQKTESHSIHNIFWSGFAGRWGGVNVCRMRFRANVLRFPVQYQSEKKSNVQWVLIYRFVSLCLAMEISTLFKSMKIKACDSLGSLVVRDVITGNKGGRSLEEMRYNFLWKIEFNWRVCFPVAISYIITQYCDAFNMISSAVSKPINVQRFGEFDISHSEFSHYCTKNEVNVGPKSPNYELISSVCCQYNLPCEQSNYFVAVQFPGPSLGIL